MNEEDKKILGLDIVRNEKVNYNLSQEPKMPENLEAELQGVLTDLGGITSRLKAMNLKSITPELRKHLGDYLVFNKEGEINMPVTDNTSIKIYKKDSGVGIEVKVTF